MEYIFELYALVGFLQIFVMGLLFLELQEMVDPDTQWPGLLKHEVVLWDLPSLPPVLEMPPALAWPSMPLVTDKPPPLSSMSRTFCSYAGAAVFSGWS